jgi:uncharacterized protein YbjQ (UPF0145 family)
MAGRRQELCYCSRNFETELAMMKVIIFASLISLTATPCLAQEVGNEDYTMEKGILVTSADVLTCPYRLVQIVSANVTEDYGADSRGKIFGKLRKEAQKIDADAVVLVAKGQTHMTAFAWNRREYAGKAIRYVDRNCAPTQ